MQRILIKKYFLFTVGSVCQVNRFKTGSKNSLKDVRRSLIMPDQVRKWLRHSKNFHAAGFEAMIKRMDNFINDDGGYIEK
jgi:hypothetical protein